MDCFMMLIYFCINKIVFTHEGVLHYNNEISLFIHTYIYLQVFSVFNTCTGILDIFLVYEQIQVYKPNLTFLAKRSACKIYICIFIYSVLINLFLNISRKNHEEILILESGSIKVYYYGFGKIGQYQFDILKIFSLFVRDVFFLIIEIIISIILIRTVIQYHKTGILTRNVRTRINNSKIAFFMNFISSTFRLYTFFLVVLIQLHFYDAYYIFSRIYKLLLCLKNGSNFFLLLKLNRKFRENFLLLVSKLNVRSIFANKQTNENLEQVTNKNVEGVNLKSMTTHL